MPNPRRLRSPARRIAELVVGWAAIVATPIVGLLPGPGGIFVFAFGAPLVLRNSITVRRWYARMLHRRPRLKRWSDVALRRSRKRAVSEGPAD